MVSNLKIIPFQFSFLIVRLSSLLTFAATALLVIKNNIIQMFFHDCPPHSSVWVHRYAAICLNTQFQAAIFFPPNGPTRGDAFERCTVTVLFLFSTKQHKSCTEDKIQSYKYARRVFRQKKNHNIHFTNYSKQFL